nr:MAG TPA: tail protein [Bacteriophage sp.]
MQEFEINSSCYVNDKFIGTTVAKKATVKLLDDGNYSLENKDINIKTGIEINNAKEYQKLGTYTIPKPDTEEVSGNTSFTGYDYMKKFDTLYVDSNTYPIRLDACLENLCSQVGLTLGNKNFPNNSYMLKGNPFTNRETRKTVLSNLVQLAGGFAEIDVEDGKLYVRNLDVSGEAVETIDGNNYDGFKPNNVFGPVNSVRIQMNSGVDGEETIKEAEGVTDENRCQITIADNYYLTSAEEREAVINGIFNVLNGLTYLPIELSYYGYPWLKLGDKIKVKDKSDKEYVTYVMEHTLKYNGAYSGTIKAIALTKTQQAYKEVLSLKDWRRNTELAVDKINGKMTAVIEEQSEQGEKLTKTEQDVNGLTTKVSSLEKTTVNKVQVQYALGDTLTTPPTAGWSETAPEWQAGKYMWQKTVTTYSDGATKESKATCIQGAKGETGASGTDGKDGTNGTNGKNGNDGRGIASTVITYQASSSGTTTPTGTWQSTIPTVTAGHYLWTKTVINYTSGEPTTSYSVSMMGKAGANGKNGTSISITSKSVTYQIGTSGTTTPTGTWSTSVPTLESGKYLWTKTYVKYSDSSETTSYAVSYCAKDGVKGDTGATGKGIKSIQDQYYLSTSNTTQTGGAWKNTQDAWKSGKYIWTRSHITWSDDTTTDTTPILAESLNTANENAVLAQEKTAEQKIEIDSIKQTVSQTQTTVANNYTEIKQKFGDYAPKSDVITLQNSVERIQTDTYTKTEINTKLTDGSVTKVTTTCGTFDENGLTIEKTNAKTKGNFNEKGMKVVDATGSSEEILLFAGYDEETDETIVKSKNMTVEKYLTIGANCRFEDYVNPILGGKGTGAFTL